MSVTDLYKTDVGQEAARVMNAGIDIHVGGRRIVFRMLPIQQDMEWRRAMANVYAGIAKAEQAESVGTVAIINYLATDGMDALIDACFMLAPTVDKGAVLERATRAELADMCCRVMEEFYLPFVRSCLAVYQAAVPR